MTATRPRGLDARYGRSRQRSTRTRVGAIAVAVTLAAAGVVWVAWTGLFAPDTRIDQRDLGFRLAGSSAIVTYEVTAPPGRAIGCAVAAKSDTSAIVGWKIVQWPASRQRVREFTTTVRTSQNPVSGLISRCWLT